MREWFVVQTAPKKETAIEKAIQGLEFATLLPLCFWYRHHNHRRERVTGPLFPCYLFAEFDARRDPWMQIIRTPGQDGARTVLGMVENAGTPQPVAPKVVASIRRLMEAHDGQIRLEPERKQRFRHNDPIRILNGPFSGLSGFVLLDQRARVKCLLDFFGRKTEICLQRESIALAATVA